MCWVPLTYRKKKIEVHPFFKGIYKEKNLMPATLLSTLQTCPLLSSSLSIQPYRIIKKLASILSLYMSKSHYAPVYWNVNTRAQSHIPKPNAKEKSYISLLAYY